MSNISQAAYYSELLNIRNMLKTHDANIHELAIRVAELSKYGPTVKCIDDWLEGDGKHETPYSADCVYKKVEELIKQVEEENPKLDEIITKIDTITELENNQTKKIRRIEDILENSVEPTVGNIEVMAGDIQTTTTEIKGLINERVIPNIEVSAQGIERINEKIDTDIKVSLGSIQQTVETILEILQNKEQN